MKKILNFKQFKLNEQVEKPDQQSVYTKYPSFTPTFKNVYGEDLVELQGGMKLLKPGVTKVRDIKGNVTKVINYEYINIVTRRVTEKPQNFSKAIDSNNWFEKAKSTLTDEARANLTKIVEELKKEKISTILKLSAFASKEWEGVDTSKNKEGDEYTKNITLAKNRAKTVKEFLESNGIKVEKATGGISDKGSMDNENELRQERKVVFEYKKAGGDDIKHNEYLFIINASQNNIETVQDAELSGANPYDNYDKLPNNDKERLMKWTKENKIAKAVGGNKVHVMEIAQAAWVRKEDIEKFKKLYPNAYAHPMIKILND